MAKTHFTADQERAITDGVPDYQEQPARGSHNLLVSASAGSGKTAVLVERIRRQILAGGDVTRMLVVTFTNAAAAEMKAKIDTALKQYLTAERSKMSTDARRHLMSQIGQVDSAPISTLDAFALQVVQQYYYVVNLDPNFRILADQTEALLIQEEVWADLRESLYVNEAEAFGNLTQNFATGWHDDILGDLVLRLYTFAMTTTDPIAWLNALPTTYAADLTAVSPFMVQLARAIQPTLSQARELLQQAQELTTDPSLAKWATIITQDCANVDAVVDQLGNDYTELHTAIRDLTWPRWAAGKIEDELLKEDKDNAKKLRDAAKSLIEKHVLPLVQLDTQDLEQTLTGSQAVVQELAHVAELFYSAYGAEKKRRHVMDFGDIEQGALQILTATDPDTGTRVGDAFKAQFDTVLVDEYQDTNPLQEALLDAVSQKTPGNRFMVGDVKQSIYGFRLADPTMFMDKYNAYAEAETGNTAQFREQGEHVTLAANFRSSANILEFTNLIFTQIMDRQLGAVDYSGSEKLVYGSKAADGTDAYAGFCPETELLLYAPKGDNTKDTPAETAGQAQVDKDEAQVRLVADKIRTIVGSAETQLYDRETGQMRPIEYRDITLLEPTRSQNLLIQQIFADAGIPVVVTNAQNYFKTTELQVMLAALRIVDNPLQEIPLVAVLRSPIVGLSADELTVIRIKNKNVAYYDALTEFIADFDPAAATNLAQRTYSKVAHFTALLNNWRDLARTNQLVDLIWAIYHDTGYLDFVGGLPGGKQRQANLHALYERAQTYEEGGFRGVFAFVHFIELMMKRDQDLATPVVIDPNTNAVNLMTIHGSKGLQFSIVFLMNASRKFRGGHGDGSVVLSTAGIGINWFDKHRDLTIPTPQFALISAANQAREQSENMRVLYVALTRAEQRLYVVGNTRDEDTTISKWQGLANTEETVLPFAARLDAGSALDLIGASLVRHPRFPGNSGTNVSALQTDPTQFTVHFYQTVPEVRVEDLKSDLTVPPLDIDVDNWLAYQYPFAAATTTTGFQSVSEIKSAFASDPTVRELNEQGAAINLPQNRLGRELATPQFIAETNAVDGAAIGTATHALLHELDLGAPITAVAITTALTHLNALGVVDAAVAARVNTADVLRFYESPFGQELIKNAKQVKREVPFSMLVPAKRLFKNLDDDERPILMHGIIDGYFEQDDTVVLFDYKTDRVQNEDTAPIVERYTGQLALYARALHAMTGRKVLTRLIVLETGAAVALPTYPE